MAVADKARVESAVLCGHSMMGAVALRVAAARPEAARGVVMLDTQLFYPEPLRQQALEAWNAMGAATDGTVEL